MAEAEAHSLFWVLIGTLDDLSPDNFQKFKLHLMDKTLLKTFKVIKRRRLETEDTTELLKAMMDNFGIFTISVMKIVLTEMGLNGILEELCQYRYDPEAMITECQHLLKSELKSNFCFLRESLSKSGQKMPFNEGYTELFITEADTQQVNEQHEVRQIEKFSKNLDHERTVPCQDIFRGTTERGNPVRVVLTKGVVGVGKTVLTQKFSLDWAEDKANQDIQLLFHFTFRELNVLKDTEYSLVELLHHRCKANEKFWSFQQLEMLFIFDGLDECRLPLDFSQTRVLTESTESVSVEVLLVNLIRGSLLPSARVWITTRPAAANQIPAECISIVTEVRGFTDLQKEQYFRKRFLEKEMADKIISHVKRIRSLYIMSFIPIFCWIISTVLQTILEQTNKSALPNTMTEMYIHFLVVQAKIKNIKYHGGSGADRHWTPETKEMLKSLGKLAFEQLQNGKLIFYESDLSECGQDAAETARYSGVFTEVFREERGLYQDKVYCFIHLSVQEFLAALHVHQTFFSSGENLLLSPISKSSKSTKTNTTVPPFLLRYVKQYKPTPEETFYHSAVDRALQSPNGNLDLFLRFLLGLSLPTNQRLLPGLLTETGSDQTNQKIVKYIKEKLNEEGLSAERSLNLLHCLNELNDLSLMETIQQNMREGALSDRNMSPAQWSALSYVLLSSNSDLDEFDLRKYCPTEKGLLGLRPVIKASTKAILSGCNLTQNICAPLASVLSSSSLTELDLSNNDLQDSGVELLCEGLKKLHTLRLRTCNLSQEVCAPLASLLSSSSLTELDLCNNDLQDSGVELLCEGLKSATCRLQTLRLSGCLVSEWGVASLASALSSVSHLRNLDLSYNHPGASAELLTALQAPHGPLQTLRLDPAGEQWMVRGPRKYYCELTLDPDTAHRHLHLSPDKRTARRGLNQHYPDHEDRFDRWPQVLCSSGLWGRFYWEAQWSGWQIDIAVCYKGIKRSGDDSRFENTDQSCVLRIEHEQYYFVHNKKKMSVAETTKKDESSFPSVLANVVGSALGLSGPKWKGRVGVFLDSEAGALSFYDVGDDEELSHIYTYHCPFTEPLFPGFGLWGGSPSSAPSVSLVKVKTERTQRSQGLTCPDSVSA